MFAFKMKMKRKSSKLKELSETFVLFCVAVGAPPTV